MSSNRQDQETDQQISEKVIVGRITGVYGVKGWLKVFSYTDPMEAIVDYDPWFIRPEGRSKLTPGQAPWNRVGLETGKRHAKTVVVKFAGCDDRDQAMPYIGCEIAIEKTQLETLKNKDEYYWHDLLGLRVINQQNIELGIVKDILETGVNDVLVVYSEAEKKERLIPWTMHNAVVAVDLKEGVVDVEWDADF